MGSGPVGYVQAGRFITHAVAVLVRNVACTSKCRPRRNESTATSSLRQPCFAKGHPTPVLVRVLVRVQGLIVAWLRWNLQLDGSLPAVPIGRRLQVFEQPLVGVLPALYGHY